MSNTQRAESPLTNIKFGSDLQVKHSVMRLAAYERDTYTTLLTKLETEGLQKQFQDDQGWCQGCSVAKTGTEGFRG
ncbi:hypothetical protein RRF57_011678 [Xylaria bambusicola]|uniref:Uncharacterized protein n=1 Tax=Xylaria bambusicola TaxID=326684 RepID=A0AAN7UZU5_9PEZI